MPDEVDSRSHLSQVYLLNLWYKYKYKSSGGMNSDFCSHCTLTRIANFLFRRSASLMWQVCRVDRPAVFGRLSAPIVLFKFRE